MLLMLLNYQQESILTFYLLIFHFLLGKLQFPPLCELLSYCQNVYQPALDFSLKQKAIETNLADMEGVLRENGDSRKKIVPHN